MNGGPSAAVNVPLSHRSDALANRQRLVQAAREVFSERGTGADIKEIVERAGVGIGTVYRNFATKDDLLAEIVSSVMAEVRERLAHVCDLQDPVASVVAMFRIALSYAESEGPLLVALQRVFPVGALDEDPRLLLRTVLTEGVASGVVRDDVPVDVLVPYLQSHFAFYIELRATLSEDEARAAIESLALSAIVRPGLVVP